MARAARRIRHPDPSADRPRGWKLALVAFAAFASGLGLVQVTLSEPRTARTSEAGGGAADERRADGERPADDERAAAASGADGGAPHTPSAAADAAAVAAPQADADGGSERAAKREPEVTQPPPAGAPVARHGDHVVRLEQVAYLRCDGLPPAPGPFPCPRDRKLEQRVWTALRALPRCEQPTAGTGGADLRLQFEPDGVPEVRLRGAKDGPSLDRDWVAGCLAGPLATVQTQLRADLLVVSFRFRIERAAG